MQQVYGGLCGTGLRFFGRNGFPPFRQKKGERMRHGIRVFSGRINRKGTKAEAKQALYLYMSFSEG
jgi:hypothetical protein